MTKRWARISSRDKQTLDFLDNIAYQCGIETNNVERSESGSYYLRFKCTRHVYEIFSDLYRMMTRVVDDHEEL